MVYKPRTKVWQWISTTKRVFKRVTDVTGCGLSADGHHEKSTFTRRTSRRGWFLLKPNDRAPITSPWLKGETKPFFVWRGSNSRDQSLWTFCGQSESMENAGQVKTVNVLYGFRVFANFLTKNWNNKKHILVLISLITKIGDEYFLCFIYVYCRITRITSKVEFDLKLNLNQKAIETEI